MDTIQLINQLSALGGRVGKAEKPAYDLLCRVLQAAGIPFTTQTFTSHTPLYKQASLVADGEPVECLPCGLKSGQITSNYNLISSLTSSQNFIDTPNINFNPKSDAIGTPNYYFAPALAVSRRDVARIMRAKKILGTLEVKKQAYTVRNILIGNTVDPKQVVFAHYDGYFSGATDNASGVATVFAAINKNRASLKNNLFVLAGNEELSFDYPIYWGRCFRQFNLSNPGLLQNAKKIYVVDSVGDGSPTVESDPGLRKLAFPVGIDSLVKKTAVITGDFDALMSVYHSPADTPQRLNLKYLQDTAGLIASL